MKIDTKTRMLLCKVATVVTLAAAFLLAVPRAGAEDDACVRRTARADHRLHEAIEHHGYTSWQANRARHELHEARERCWGERHQWWNEHEHRWHHEHDWDDRDHDHD